jgi:hypothetical protein
MAGCFLCGLQAPRGAEEEDLMHAGWGVYPGTLMLTETVFRCPSCEPRSVERWARDRAAAYAARWSIRLVPSAGTTSYTRDNDPVRNQAWAVVSPDGEVLPGRDSFEEGPTGIEGRMVQYYRGSVHAAPKQA